MKNKLLHIFKNPLFHSYKKLLLLLFLITSAVVVTIYAQQRSEIRQQAQTVTTLPTASVDIVDFQYNPKVLTVTVGTTVTWTNRSTAGVPHTTTSDVSTGANAWDSQIMSPGNSYSKTFNSVGTFKYHCAVHGAGMSAQVIVVPAATVVPTIQASNAPIPTQTPAPSLTPTPPKIYCLGSCPKPTYTPTPTPARPTAKPRVLYAIPTPTPTPARPTAKPRVLYAIPTPTPTTPPYPTSEPITPTQYPTATIDPCPTNYYDSSTSTTRDNLVTTASDVQITHNRGGYGLGHGHGHGGGGGFIQFILDLFFKWLQLWFNINLRTPSPVPSPIVTPTPTGAIIHVTNTPEPTQPIYYPTPTSPYQTPTPTPPCIPPTSTPEPTNYYPSPTPVVSPTGLPSSYPTLAPSPYGQRSVDSFRYVPGNEPLKTFNLVAQVVGNQWLFNGLWPGPLLHVNQGDHVKVNVSNLLPEGLTVHWHGIRLPASQDGVAGVTQDAIKPGASQEYDFVVPESGTYWYHSHQNTSRQLPKGLFGALVVDPKQETTHYDRDYSVVYRNSNNPLPERFEARPGEKVKVRLLNSRVGDSSGTPLKIVPVGLPFKVVALDGQDIYKPQEITSPQLLEIGFAQRYDLEFTMPSSGSAQLEDIDNLQRITIGQDNVTPPDGLNAMPVFDFMTYGVPTQDTYLPRMTFDQEQTLTIGPNLTINGQLSPNVPDMVVKEGQVALIHYVNASNMTHPMHLHGHFYSVIKKNGVATTGSPIHLDTILLHPGETADVAFYANDPGVWMLHCHVLSHASAGLSMLVKYDDVYTPYKMGGDSGNMPE
jgi:FtsP/CotA-like multicopper oxidase with cupredoxin domain/plastocyanin